MMYHFTLKSAKHIKRVGQVLLYGVLFRPSYNCSLIPTSRPHASDINIKIVPYTL